MAASENGTKPLPSATVAEVEAKLKELKDGAFAKSTKPSWDKERGELDAAMRAVDDACAAEGREAAWKDGVGVDEVAKACVLFAAYLISRGYSIIQIDAFFI